MILGAKVTPYTKINSRCVKEFKCKKKEAEFVLEENTSDVLTIFEQKKPFQTIILSKKPKKGKTDLTQLYNIKHFCMVKKITFFKKTKYKLQHI